MAELVLYTKMERIQGSQEQQISGKAPSPTAGIELVNRALNAMYVHKPPVSYKQIFEAVGLHPTTVSLALSTARDLGLTQYSGRRGTYQFTRDGEDYSRYLSLKRLTECSAILKRVLLTSPLWSGVIGFLRVNEDRPRDPTDLVIDVERRLGKTWSKSMRNTVTDSFVSILEFAELVKIHSGKIVSTIGSEEYGLQPVNKPTYEPVPTMESGSKTTGLDS